MDLLIGPNLHVILSIKEGRGFEFLDHPLGLCVEASLNGHALSTEVATPSAEIIFDAELLWEAEKKALKRLRCANIPLKVECFLVAQNKRDRFGYIPINLKAAQIILPGSTVEVSSIWHTLLGIGPEAKGHRPQLLLSFRITDPIDNLQGSHTMPHGNHSLNVCPHTIHHYIPELLQDEGIIQIGPKDTATDMFLFTICVGQALKLDLLTDMEQLHADSFYFALNILGYVIQAGSFSDLASFTSNTVEKIVIRIRSSMGILKTYFTDVSVVTLRFMLGQKEIAFSELDITHLVPTYDLSAFCTQYAINNTMAQKYRCFLVKSQTGEIPVGLDGSRPFVNIIIKLKYLNGDDDISLAKGDAKKLYSSTSSISLPFRPTVASRGDVTDEQSQSPAHQEKCETSIKTLTCTSPDNVDHCFSLDITLQSILLYKLPPYKRILFRFEMPNATIIPSSHPEVSVEQTNMNIHLQGVMCKLNLRVSLDELHHQLLKQPPIVTVCAISDEKVVPFSFATLDMGFLLIREQKDCRYTAALRDPMTNEGYGVLVVCMALEDSIPYIPLVKQDVPLKPPSPECKGIQTILDDGIAYKIVEELEDWKDRQEELFKSELKKKEKAHMDAVLAAWEIRRKTFESSMNNSVEQCSTLAKSLNDTTESLRIKSQALTHRELELTHLEKTLEQEYQLKTCELRESARRQDDDNNLKVSTLKLERNELLDKIKSLEKELSLIRGTIDTQEEELKKMRKSSLTQDQTASLLQELKSVEEKHQCALRSKAFFKEQWARAVREIHRIKSEHQNALQIQIKHNREELHRLGLQDLLIGNEKEMHGDKEVLQKLQIELNKHRACMQHGDILNQKAIDLMNQEVKSVSGQSLRTDLKASSSNNLMASAPQVDELEHRLEQLVEERDSLLNTGNYTLEDAVVIQLNKEIRQLLIQSNGNT